MKLDDNSSHPSVPFSQPLEFLPEAPPWAAEGGLAHCSSRLPCWLQVPDWLWPGTSGAGPVSGPNTGAEEQPKENQEEEKKEPEEQPAGGYLGERISVVLVARFMKEPGPDW